MDINKVEMRNSLKEIGEKTIQKIKLRKSINPLLNAKEVKGKQANKLRGEGNYSRHENWNRRNKENTNQGNLGNEKSG